MSGERAEEAGEDGPGQGRDEGQGEDAGPLHATLEMPNRIGGSEFRSHYPKYHCPN